MSWPAHKGKMLSRRQQLFPRLEAVPEFNRGEQRLAAEAALAELRGERVPLAVQARTVRILQTMARA